MLLAGRNGMSVPKPLDISDMTQLEITATAQNLTYGIRKGVLASGSSSVRIYWDALGNDKDYTDYSGGFEDATHTYSAAGDYVVAISDDIATLSITGNSSTPSFIPNSRMLRKVTTGQKVATLMSPGGGADEGLYFDSGTHLIEYINLRNVTSALRPAFHVMTTGGTLIANSISQIGSYGVEGAYSWDIYCDSLTALNLLATSSATGAKFRFTTKTCNQILSMSNVLITDLRNIDTLRFYGTDGYVYWDGSAWVQTSNLNGGGRKCLILSPYSFSRSSRRSAWKEAA